MATPDPTPRTTAILYQNTEKTITLLDIPTSISLAFRGTPTAPHREIYSALPPQVPYPSTEPKSDRARANVMRIMGSSSRFPTTLLRDALDEVKRNHGGPCCLPRRIAPFSVSTSCGRGGKRKFMDEKGWGGEMEPSIQIPTDDGRWRRGETRNGRALSKTHREHFPDVGAIARRLVHNPSSVPLPISIGTAVQTYSIPPQTAFYLTNIDKSSISDFSTAAQSSLSTPTASAGPGQFDFILLDPPWDNSSVKRAGRYNTIRQSQDPMLALQEPLGKHIAPGGLVACWITNKEHVRECALAAFDSWAVELVEEWAWLKTTVDGLPVTDLEGLWRKPYEILCLGRQVDFSFKSGDSTTASRREVLKRIILAAPDLHSRKPCLKELVEPLMPIPAEYRALEIFARSLTTGWWSWGNEAIKYNWDGYWHRNE